MLLAKITGTVVGLAGLAAMITGFSVLAQTPAQVSASKVTRTLKDSIAIARLPSATRLVLPGSTALDTGRVSRVRARFAPARVIELGRVWAGPASVGRLEHRELKTGDHVRKRDLLTVFYCAEVASRKNHLLNALVQLELDQKIMDRLDQIRAAIPEVLYRSQQRAVQTDRTEVNRALNNLKAWDIPQEDIDAVRTEAKKTSADPTAWVRTREGRWLRAKKQANNDLIAPKKQEEHPWGIVTLRAPFDGVIVERNLHVDEMVVDNTAILFQIADVNRLLVLANCPEDSLPALEALSHNQRRWTVQTVGTNLPGGLPGTIDEIGYVVDPNQHTAVIKGYVDNPGQHIRAGQYVTATVDVPPPADVVEVPAEAIVEDGRQSLVFAQTDPAKHQFTARRVQVMRRLDGKVWVRSSAFREHEQPSALEAERGLLPKEPLRVGERVLLCGPAQPVENRLGALERKLDQVLHELEEKRRLTPALGSDLRNREK